MSSLLFSIDIDTPKQTVWDTMLSPDSYQQWSSTFHDGSFFEGSWDEGSQIRFLAEDDGQLNGLFARVAKNIPFENITLEYAGAVLDGVNDSTSDDAQQWVGAYETYTFEDRGDNATRLTVEMDGANISPQLIELFANLWPQALEKLKDLAEAK